MSDHYVPCRVRSFCTLEYMHRNSQTNYRKDVSVILAISLTEFKGKVNYIVI